jgi:protein gp37
MSDKSPIQWTDATWNPVRGCSRVSEGCRNCYAEGVAARFAGPGRPYEGLARFTPRGPQWTGEIRLVAELLEQPLRWRKPRRVFVNSMSDLFHEDVPFRFIASVFGHMHSAPRHTFQVLTKRAARMREFVEWFRREWLGGSDAFPRQYPHVWLGVSVEDQAAADERIPHLLATPAAVRFLSCEPLLGPVDLREAGPMPDGDSLGNGLHNWGTNTGVDWVIVGGESGRRARPLEVAWARSLVEQCRAAAVPVFVKQLGAVWARESNHYPLGDAAGGDPAEWPEDLRVREMPSPEAHDETRPDPEEREP